MLNFIKSILNFTISFLYKSKDSVFLLNNKPTTQYLQDQTLPDLKVKIVLTPPVFSKFNVRNLTSTGNAVNTLVWQSENVYANINSSLRFMKKYFPVNIKNWAATTNLTVLPRAGNDANAYYDRSSLSFFYFKGNSNKIIYTCDSADIVTHELGHAILDAIRPDFWNTAAFEVAAFHESFGDIYAILTALNYDLVLNKVLAVTKNNLKKENLVSDLAEQFGRTLGIGNSLRDAYNSYSYVDPMTLPTSSSPSYVGLIKEVHSFSQVFTGVFYELLTEFYELFGKNKAGLIKARDLSSEFIFNAVKNTPATEKFFMAVANNYLAYSLSKYAGSYTAILTKVFTKRNLMPIPLVKKLNNSSIDIMSEYEDNILFKEEKIMALNCEDVGVEEICGFKSINVQIAADSFKTKSGMFNILSVNHNEEESKDSAKNFVKYLVDNKEIGNDKESWFIDEKTNSLTRKHACCGFGFINNCTIEGQPEHGKCWKSENNSGCCPYGCQSTSIDVTSVKPTCSIAYNNCSGNSYRVCNSFKRV